MSQIESSTTLSPEGINEACCKITITDELDTLVLSNQIAETGQYAIQFWIKSTSVSGNICVASHEFEEYISVTSDWQKVVVVFPTQAGCDINIDLPQGIHYIYHTKLERGNTPTDWSLSSDDLLTRIDATLATLAAMANDSIITVSEKQAIKTEWIVINNEYSIYISEATTYRVDTTNYIRDYSTLNTYLNNSTDGILYDMNTDTTNVVRNTFNNNFKNYYGSRTDLDNILAYAKAELKANDVADELEPEISDAAKTATNYMSFDNVNGLVIGDQEQTTLGNNIKIDSNDIEIRDGSTVLARYGEEINMYRNGDSVFSITNSSFLAEAQADGRILTATSERSTVPNGGYLHCGYFTGYQGPAGTGISVRAGRTYVWFSNTANKYISFIPTGNITITTITWSIANPSEVLVSGGNVWLFPCGFCDGDSVFDMDLKGNIWIDNDGDINARSNSAPVPLGIGVKDGNRVEIDSDEINSKDANGASHIAINKGGGSVSINEEGLNGFKFEDGKLYARYSQYYAGTYDTDARFGDWYNILEAFVDDDLEHLALGWGMYSANYGSTYVCGNTVKMMTKANYVSANKPFLTRSMTVRPSAELTIASYKASMPLYTLVSSSDPTDENQILYSSDGGILCTKAGYVQVSASISPYGLTDGDGIYLMINKMDTDGANNTEVCYTYNRCWTSGFLAIEPFVVYISSASVFKIYAYNAYGSRGNLGANMRGARLTVTYIR